MPSILSVQSSPRGDESISRKFSAEVIEKLGGDAVVRDVSAGLPVVDGGWVGANFTPAEDRTPEQMDRLALSDEMIAELKAADTIVIGLPVWNFGMPAQLKAWFDHVCRAGITFRYSENGPVGLLEGKRAVIVMASGGTEADGPVDYATPHVRHLMGFIGIEDVQTVAADKLMVDQDATMAQAKAAIADLEV